MRMETDDFQTDHIRTIKPQTNPKQIPKHTEYFWAFGLVLLISLNKRFCVLRTTKGLFRTAKGLLRTNPKTYEVFLGVWISDPDIPK